MKKSCLRSALLVSAACLCTAAIMTWSRGRDLTSRADFSRPPSIHHVNLDFKLAHFRVESETLGQVVDDLAEKTGENFAIDWWSLSPELTATQIVPVSLRLRGVSLRESLDALSTALDASDHHVQFHYFVRGGIIIVTSLPELHEPTVTRAYNVRDLVERERASMYQRHIPTDTSPAGPGNPPADEYQAATDWIVQAIQRMLSDATGDTSAVFSELAGCLIVTATPGSHQQIAEFLEQLRHEPAASQRAR